MHARSLFLINKPQGKSIVPETTCEHFFKPFQNEKNSRVKVNETRHFNDHSYFLVPAQKNDYSYTKSYHLSIATLVSIETCEIIRRREEGEQRLFTII